MTLLLLAALAPGLAQQPVDTPPDQDSVWSEIERESGVQLDPESVQAAKELAEERFDEQRFLGTGGVGQEPEWAIYLDPVRALAEDPLHLAKVVPAEFDIPVVVNPMVEKWMRYFTGRGHGYFSRYLGRANRYRSMIYEQLDAADLPRDLLYLSMIESGFSNNARSYASAVGLWQFMAATGRAYGLRVDYWVDERTDPEKSTAAAIKYLADLYEVQGDWYLAWASYNAGPGRVSGAARKNGTRNFWVIAENGTLAVETCNYVPKIIAAAILGKHPERYGFNDYELSEELVYESVEVQGAYSVDVLAKLAGTDVETLQSLNPALLRGATPPKGSTQVRIPVGSAETFIAAREELPEQQRVSYQRHRVRKGESLGSIATHYGVSVDTLVRVNKIQDPNHIYPGMELVVPVGGVALAAPAIAKPPRQAASHPAPSGSATKTTHTVRSGETLAAIATAYGVSIQDLVAQNDLRAADHIEVGQKLVVVGGSPQSTKKLSYTVKAGDSLSLIADDFGVTTAQVMEWNGLRSANHIEPGQVLKLYGAGHQWSEYLVKPGDSLGMIAQNNGCTVSELRAWNDLGKDMIHPGQTLRIKKSG